MSTHTGIESIPSDYQAIIDAAREGRAPQELLPGVWLVSHEGGRSTVEDLRAKADETRDAPLRHKGTVTVEDVDSLEVYWNKHGLPESEVWASRDAAQITVIVNAAAPQADGAAGRAGWRDHRVVLQLRHTQDWKDWSSADGKWFTQADFAEFAEKHLPNFVSPTSAAILELVEGFQAVKNVRFDSTRRLQSGATSITYHEDVDAKVGKRGDIEIPPSFVLQMQVYEGGAPVGVDARFRYRIDGGDLRLGVVLQRPADVVDALFGDVVAEVSDVTGHEVLRGKP